MIKKKLQALLLLSNIFGFSQVGVQTTQPQSTLDVSAKRTTTGGLAEVSKHVGLQAPRMTLAELGSLTASYTSNQIGSILYITDASTGSASGQRINIKSPGYYYFDGTVWQKLQDRNDNIYNIDGQLTGTRTLDYNDKFLYYGLASKGQYVEFSQSNGLVVNKPTSGTRSSMGLTSGDQTMWLFNDQNSSAQITLSGTGTGLNIGPSYTTNPAYISFMTSTGNNSLGVERMRLHAAGNISIGGSAEASERLQLNDGTLRIPSLPLHGTPNSIHTTTTGTMSSAKDQTFTATKTVVVDKNGVFGYVDGLPGSIAITRVAMPSTNYVLAAGNSTTAKYTGISITIPPGSYKIDLNLGLTLETKSTYTVGTNFVRFRLAESTSDVTIYDFSPDAIAPRYASQGFPFAQAQGVVTGSLAVKNESGAAKTYYLHIDNAASNNEYLQVRVNANWNESSIVYYPITEV